jgi:hypothetical protein
MCQTNKKAKGGSDGATNEPPKQLLQAARCEPNLGLAMGQLALRFKSMARADFWGVRCKPLILSLFVNFCRFLSAKKRFYGSRYAASEICVHPWLKEIRFAPTTRADSGTLSLPGPVECGLTNPARAGRQQRQYALQLPQSHWHFFPLSPFTIYDWRFTICFRSCNRRVNRKS